MSHILITGLFLLAAKGRVFNRIINIVGEKTTAAVVVRLSMVLGFRVCFWARLEQIVNVLSPSERK